MADHRVRRPSATAGMSALVAAVLAAVSACAPLSPPPYATPAPVAATPAPSGGDGFTHAERIALRVWVAACSSYRNGTAWMLDEHRAVTNRHVVKGASEIRITDYQGTPYDVTGASYSTTDDLGLLTIDGSFPERATLASEDPSPGDPVLATGFALGGPLAAAPGTLVELGENALDRDGAEIYYLRMHAVEGNSGSPVTDASGDVVGVLFSSNQETFAGAITLERLQAFLAEDAARTEVDESC